MKIGTIGYISDSASSEIELPASGAIIVYVCDLVGVPGNIDYLCGTEQGTWSLAFYGGHTDNNTTGFVETNRIIVS